MIPKTRTAGWLLSTLFIWMRKAGSVPGTPYAPKPVFGGLSSGIYADQITQVYLNGDVLEDGGVAISVGGDVKLSGVISQGCTPIGETWTLTRVEQNLIHQIANRPAYAVLAETVQQLSAADQQKARGNLFIGLVMNEYLEDFHWGDFCAEPHWRRPELRRAGRGRAGPALERKGDIAAFLTALEPRSVFFVDEIHRLPRTLEETFYPAMEDSRLPITVGQGAGARVVTLELPPFTLVGATTRTGLLTTPLRDRFGIQARLESYSVERARRDRAALGRHSEIALEEAGAVAIAERSRGTPRVANRLLKRVRDYAEVRMEGVVSESAARAALEMLEVDDRGLDRLDREILRAICLKFDGGPVGLSTLAVAVGEEQDTIEDVYEPYLLTGGPDQAHPARQSRNRGGVRTYRSRPPRPGRAGSSEHPRAGPMP